MADGRVMGLRDPDLPDGLGGKVRGLRWLADHGYRVPRTWVLRSPGLDRAEVTAALQACVDVRRRYAVRSSANVEDGGTVSYAGQFTSVLDVTGVAAIGDAGQHDHRASLGLKNGNVWVHAAGGGRPE